MAELPTGTVTFLFTDLEGSTRLWEQHPEAMREALARHDELLREAVESRAVPEEDFAAAWQRGHNLGFDATIALALDEAAAIAKDSPAQETA
jgi:class 3 adenylate cyclase